MEPCFSHPEMGWQRSRSWILARVRNDQVVNSLHGIHPASGYRVVTTSEWLRSGYIMAPGWLHGGH